jgi:hypothetical protein
MVIMMSKLSLNWAFAAVPLRTTAVAALAVGLTACVAQVRVAGPPVAYVEPGYVEVQAREAPPPLPDYEQPPCPEDGYLWTPGYWGWAGAGYYWVPGTWVQPPRVGVLWTPGYWGFVGGVYAFHAGYWGPHVGFYGGVNYGFGYVGTGFAGGLWVGNHYSYNRAVTNINVTVVHNTYNTTVINNVTVNKVSYNGGAGGVAAVPTPQERQFEHEQHVPATAMQQQHSQQAAQNPALFAHANGGHPAIAATPRPAAFNAPGVVGARGASPQFAGRPPQPNPGARPPAPATEPERQFQGRGPGQNPQPNQSQPNAQTQSSNQPHAPIQAQGGAQKPGPGQRLQQKHEPKKHPPEKPHPKKKDDKDQGGR